MKNVSKFYNKKGWNSNDQITLDSKLFEDNRKVAENYVRKCRLKILDHVPKRGKNFLDFARVQFSMNILIIQKLQIQALCRFFQTSNN